MNNKNRKGLDIIRNVLSIIMLVLGIVLCVWAIGGTFQTLSEDEASGLAFLFIIPGLIYGIALCVLGCIGIIKHYKHKNNENYVKRINVTITIVKMILSLVVLTIFSIPLIVYYICDLIEAKMISNSKA